MSTLSFGDLAMSYRTQLNSVRIRSELQRLGSELASGRTRDLRDATGGDLGSYAAIETALTGLASYRIAAEEAATFTAAAQRSLATVQEITSELAPALLLAASTNEATILQSGATDAKARFATAVSALNTRVADRALLAGTATGGVALADAEAMLAALQAAISAETTATGVETAVAAWFDDPGGGFETGGYLGGADPLAPLQVGANETAAFQLKADDQAVRDLLKGFAIAALVADGALAGQHAERVALVEAAGTRLIGADRSLTDIRAGLGATEARIETALARNGAETSALEMARNDIVAVDPYKTATALQQAELQLETLYTITARLSRLTLTEYLR